MRWPVIKDVVPTMDEEGKYYLDVLTPLGSVVWEIETGKAWQPIFHGECIDKWNGGCDGAIKERFSESGDPENGPRLDEEGTMCDAHWAAQQEAEADPGYELDVSNE